MNPLSITGQIFGFVAMALIVLSFQFKDSRRLFVLQIGSCTFFMLHYMFLGLGGDPSAYSGMAQNALGLVFRAIILLGGRYPRLRSAVVLSVIGAAMAVLAVFTVPAGDVVALLPVVGNFLCLGSMWNGDPNVIRICQLAVISPAWLVYALFRISVAGIIVESFNIISIAVYYIRLAAGKQSTNRN